MDKGVFDEHIVTISPDIAALCISMCGRKVAVFGVDFKYQAVAAVASFFGDVVGVYDSVLSEEGAPGAHVFTASGHLANHGGIEGAGNSQVDAEHSVATVRIGDCGSVHAGGLPHQAVAPNVDAIGRGGVVYSHDIVGVNNKVEYIDGVGVIVGNHDSGVVVVSITGDVPSVGGASYQVNGLNDSWGSINLGECRKAGKGQKQTE